MTIAKRIIILTIIISIIRAAAPCNATSPYKFTANGTCFVRICYNTQNVHGYLRLNTMATLYHILVLHCALPLLLDLMETRPA